MENVIGKSYGRLTVLKDVKSNSRRRRVLVKCSCPAETEKEVTLDDLRSGHTSSCGCLRVEAVQVAVSKHGLNKHPSYGIWKNMRQRCLNPKNARYSDYGGRGITICESWKDFFNFYEDIGKSWKSGLTLDREDNNQGYSPENCRWSTTLEQNRNRRNTKTVSVGGRTQSLAAWCEEKGLKYDTVKMRLHRGKTPEEALELVKT
jgi:hypothetical protein